MRKVSFLLAVALAVVSAGLWSCEKEEDVGSVVQDSVHDNPDPGPGPGPGPDTLTVNWVDLGLPSGLLWAEWNLGATKPEESGNYYAWGEIQPKEVYNWSNYRYCTVDSNGNVPLTKYNTSSPGTVDNLVVLQAMDDAATAALGNGARTPQKAEWEELKAYTTVEWTALNGVNGLKLTSTANGNNLFLPAVGRLHGSELVAAGSLGYYWSSTLYAGSPLYAWHFVCESSGQYVGYFDRCDGFPVRAVRPARSAK